jgi:hypothetical protein
MLPETISQWTTWEMEGAFLGRHPSVEVWDGAEFPPKPASKARRQTVIGSRHDDFRLDPERSERGDKAVRPRDRREKADTQAPERRDRRSVTAPTPADGRGCGVDRHHVIGAGEERRTVRPQIACGDGPTAAPRPVRIHGEERKDVRSSRDAKRAVEHQDIGLEEHRVVDRRLATRTDDDLNAGARDRTSTDDRFVADFFE